MAFAVLVFYLVPTLPCLVRLRDEGNQNKPKVDRFQIWIYRALRVALLLVCLWLAFDPAVSPRQIVMRQFEVSLPLLSFDYLNALGAGFLAGSLLLVFRNGFAAAKRSRSSRFMVAGEAHGRADAGGCAGFDDGGVDCPECFRP